MVEDKKVEIHKLLSIFWTPFLNLLHNLIALNLVKDAVLIGDSI